MSPAITAIPPAMGDAARPTCCRCLGELSDVAVKCSSCQANIHLRCSEFPEYTLVRLALTQAQYMCPNCVKTKAAQTEDHYDSEATKIKEAIAKEISLIQEVGAVNSDDVVSLLSKEDVPDARNNDVPPDEPKTDEKISPKKNIPCKYYMRKGCKHGRKGTNCTYEHPKLCFKFIQHGDKRGGCKLGKSCTYAHPKLCDSYKSGICRKERCNFYHIKGTKFEHGTNRGSGQTLNGDADYQRPDHRQVPTPPPSILQRPKPPSDSPTNYAVTYNHEHLAQVDPRDILEMKAQ